MFGALIGDIVGSKYEFHNLKTKNFPFFSRDCDYTDDTIMTSAVAKAILLSRHEQFVKDGKGRCFQEFLVETMQNFGRIYPHPTGGYGGNFAKWLRQENPMPYGSYGNGSAMRVSPCGLVAVTIEEALALARASASVTHDHPEGIKGAEAVAAAIFFAKCGKSKTEIRQYIAEHYYNIDFTLDSIRETYKFDESCQGSVPQAIVAFLESENFEDAIRNVISIGGDCDTTGAITGSIAWVYYAVQTGGYGGWVDNKFDPSMLKIKSQAMGYLPKDIIEIAEELHELCWRRAGTYGRVGGVTSILNQDEIKKFWTDWDSSSNRHSASSFDYCENSCQYTLNYIMQQEGCSTGQGPGACVVRQDKFLHKWRLKIQLDKERLWFLSVFVSNQGTFDKYSLDEEAAYDSHYEFREEEDIRKKLYIPGDENLYFHEILIRYLKEHGDIALMDLIKPYVTAQYHFD